MNAPARRNPREEREIARRKKTWNWAVRHSLLVSVNMAAKAEIQDLTLELLTRSAKGLSKDRLEKWLSKPRSPETWNLISLVLQTLFEDHPSVPEILRKIEEIGCLEWKKNPR